MVATIVTALGGNTQNQIFYFISRIENKSTFF